MYAIKPVYKAHSREPENVAFIEQLPFIFRFELNALFINGNNIMRLSFIDSDLLYRGTL